MALVALVAGLATVVATPAQAATVTSVAWDRAAADYNGSATLTVDTSSPTATVVLFWQYPDGTTGNACKDALGGQASHTFTNITEVLDVRVGAAASCVPTHEQQRTRLKIRPKVTLNTATRISRQLLASPANTSVLPSRNYVLERRLTATGAWQVVPADQHVFRNTPGTMWVRARVDGNRDTVTAYSNIVKVTVDRNNVPAWLKRLNRFRKQYGAPRAAENPDLTSWVQRHVTYMVRNNELTHAENPNNRWYTVEGATAGRASAINHGGRPAATLARWMTQPFKAMALLNPEATLASWASASRYSALWPQRQNVNVDRFGSPSRPYTFPGRGAKAPRRISQGDWPSPYTSCPARYRQRLAAGGTGAPVLFSFGSDGVAPRNVSARLRVGGKRVPVCVITSRTYKNPKTHERRLARKMMRVNQHTVVLLPLHPLARGRHTAVVWADGKRHVSRFRVG